jgi:Nucleotide-diphospho-sugar transferase
MNILTVITPSHERLYREFFLKNLPADATVLEKHLQSSGDGSYLSDDWQNGVTAKLKWALEYLDHSELGSLFVLSDIDILLYPALSMTHLESEIYGPDLDILFQRESAKPECHEVNTGFYIARNTAYVRNLLTTALELCEQSATKNDQIAINRILEPADFNVKWGLLPICYYARSQGFPPPRDLVLHHANCTHSVEQKISQLRHVEIYNRSSVGRGLLILREIYDYAVDGRLIGLIRRRLRKP